LQEDGESGDSQSEGQDAPEAGPGSAGRKRDRSSADSGLLKRMRLAQDERARSYSSASGQAGGGARPSTGGHAQGDSVESTKKVD